MESFHYSINLLHSFKRKKKKKRKIKWTTFGVGLRNITAQQSHRQAPPTSRYIMFLAQARAKEGHRAGNGAMGTFAAQGGPAQSCWHR